MVQDAYMFVAGPDVVKTVTHETVTAKLGEQTHASKSGVADLAFENDIQAGRVRHFFNYLPANNQGKATLLAYETRRSPGDVTGQPGPQ